MIQPKEAIDFLKTNRALKVVFTNPAQLKSLMDVVRVNYPKARAQYTGTFEAKVFRGN